jgi:hypothetical protein
MALTRKTPAGWIKQSNGQLQTDRFGLSQATARWARLDVGDGDPGTPTAFGYAHPLWGYLDCDKVSISQTTEGWEAEASFFGVAGIPNPIYEVDFATSEEPIETHPDFVSRLAGTPGKPITGAKFDTAANGGGFLGFNGTDAGDTWRGIRAYLSPGVVWRKNYVTKTAPNDFGDVGSIDVPEGGPPGLPNGRNWLYTGLTWEQRGYTYQVKKEWRASGRRGWNSEIYRRG